MKRIFPFLLFILLSNCLSQKLGEEPDITVYELKIEMKTRSLYQLQSNKTYKIINKNSRYIYLIELEEGLKAINSSGQIFNQFVALSQENDTFIVQTPEETGKELKLYASSILNEGVSATMIKSYNFHITSLINNNVIYIL